jgi:hypothetical protein
MARGDSGGKPTEDALANLFRRTAMTGRSFVSLLVMAASLSLVQAAVAADPQLHEGIVVSAGAGKLAIKDKAGKDQSFAVDGATRVTVNGKPGRLDDLKESMPVQIMVDEKGKVLAVSTVDKEKYKE